MVFGVIMILYHLGNGEKELEIAVIHQVQKITYPLILEIIMVTLTLTSFMLLIVGIIIVNIAPNLSVQKVMLWRLDIVPVDSANHSKTGLTKPV